MKSKSSIFIFSIFLALALLFAVKITGFSATEAVNVNWGNNYQGYISNSTSSQPYQLNLSSAGRVTLTFNSQLSDVRIYVDDASGDKIWGYSYPNEGSTVYTLDLTKGTYTFYVERYRSVNGNYNFTASFASAGENFNEQNNSSTYASTPYFGAQVNGQLAINDNKDYYRYDLSSSGRITLIFNSQLSDIRVYMNDASGERVWGNKYPNEGSTVYTIDVTKGTYYLVMEKYRSATGNYNYMATFSSAGESFAEPNNTVTYASIPAFGSTIKGQLAVNDNVDIYKYTFSSTKKLTLQYRSNIAKTKLYITDASGERVWGNKYIEEGNLSYDFELGAGTYYLYIEKYSGEGNYTFNLGNFSEKTANTGTSQNTKPKKTQIAQVIRNKKKIVVIWKAKSGVSGYQVQCAINKKFKKGVKTYTIKDASKTKKKIKKLKAKKKYFIRIRTYKKTTVNGKTKKIFSKWSKVKVVKVKK